MCCCLLFCAFLILVGECFFFSFFFENILRNYFIFIFFFIFIFIFSLSLSLFSPSVYNFIVFLVFLLPHSRGKTNDLFFVCFLFLVFSFFIFIFIYFYLFIFCVIFHTFFFLSLSFLPTNKQ